ncbi:hypothetical protein SGLAM104S_00715 [Streptomyces glaucescens]
MVGGVSREEQPALPQLRDDLLPVRPQREPVPCPGQLRPYLQGGMPAEPGQHREGRFRADQRRRDDDRPRLLLAQSLRPGQQLQGERPRLRQGAGLLGGAGRDQHRGPPLHLGPDQRVEFRGVFQTGQRQQPYAGARGARQPVRGVDQAAQQIGAFTGPGVRYRHADHVRPLGVRRAAHQQPEVAVLHGGPRPEVVLEGAVHELDRPLRRFAEQAAAQQQMAEDPLRVALRRGGRQGGQHVGDDPDGAFAVQLGLVVADQPVGEPLEELDLGEFGEVHPVPRGDHVAFLVPAGEQHRQGGVVQLLPSVREVAAPVAVQGADQTAHERVGGELPEVGLGADGVEQGAFVGVEETGVGGADPRGGVPPGDERGHVVAAHGGEGEFGESVGGEPVGADGGGAGGHQPLVAGVDVEQLAQPAPGPLAVPLGDLVDAVDEEQPAAVAEHPVRPAGGLACVEGDAHGGQEGVGGGQTVGTADQGAQRQDEGDPAAGPAGARRTAGSAGRRGAAGRARAPLAALAAGRGDREPLHQRRLAGTGDAAQQDPVVLGECPVGGQGGGGGDDGPAVRVARLVVAAVRVQGREAQVGGVQGPAVGRGDEVDAVDREVGVAGGDVGEVALFEGLVGAGGRRCAGDQLVDLGHQLALAAGLLYQGARDEGGPLGEEVQDVQAGGGQQPVEEESGVAGEVAGRVAGGAAQPVRQGLGAQFHGLDVGHGEVAEGVEGVGQGMCDGLFLVGGQRAFPGREGLPDQLGGQPLDVRGAEPSFLAPEREVTGEPYGPVHQSGARALGNEEPSYERRHNAGRQPDPDGRRFHPGLPRNPSTPRLTSSVAPVTFGGRWISPSGDMPHRRFVRY